MTDSLSSFQILLKQAFGHFQFSVSLDNYVWKISTLILWSNVFKRCRLGVQLLGTWNKHQWQNVCIHLLEMGHLGLRINIPMGTTACILSWVARIVMKVLLFDRTDMFLPFLQHLYSFWATRMIYLECVKFSQFSNGFGLLGIHPFCIKFLAARFFLSLKECCFAHNVLGKFLKRDANSVLTLVFKSLYYQI